MPKYYFLKRLTVDPDSACSFTKGLIYRLFSTDSKGCGDVYDDLGKKVFTLGFDPNVWQRINLTKDQEVVLGGSGGSRPAIAIYIGSDQHIFTKTKVYTLQSSSDHMRAVTDNFGISGKVDSSNYTQWDVLKPSKHCFKDKSAYACNRNDSCYVERVGSSTNRVTQGKKYLICKHPTSGNLAVMDDQGGHMHPALDVPGYWKLVPFNLKSKTEKEKIMPNETSCAKSPCVPNELNIENVDLINDRRTDTYSTDDILELISFEQAKVAQLEHMKLDSKGIKQLTKKHTANIAKLVKILDSRV